jgi:cbb3-type cytochrome oxidase subunit 1
MKSLPFWFVFLSALFGLAGMGLGIYMGISGDHTFTPAHAHNNLLGWVSMAIYGLYYRAVPAAAVSRLAVPHFLTAFIGALLFGPGLIIVATGGTEIIVQIASLLVILSMLIFAINVLVNRPGLTNP